jgi:Tol biopolymer transport system component
VYLLHLASGTLSRLTSGPVNHLAFGWSPDGTRLLMGETGPGRTGLYSVPIESSPEVQLAKHFVWGEAHWAPDGRRVAFVAPDRRSRGRLYVIGADGTHKRLLAGGVFLGTGFFTGVFSWAPDGKRIVFARPDGLFTVSTSGRPVVRRIRIRVHVHVPALGWQPVWSPDGSSICFMVTRLPSTRIVVMRPDGSHVKLLPGGDGGHGPVWSPDSSRIAFRNSGYWVAHPNGTYSKSVLGSWSGITFSPDSARLVYIGGQAHAANGDVYAVNANLKNPVRVLHAHSLDFFLPLWRGGTASTETG